MKINEIFDSIQGEGPHAGEVTSFIRLSGCNLRCKWCDTKYAFAEGQDISVSEINPSKRWICITGGEPLLQQDELAGLIMKLKSRGQRVSIETNGSISPPDWAFVSLKFGSRDLIPMVDAWDVDIKMPSSGNPSSPDLIKEWSKHMNSGQVNLKFVVGDDLDLSEVDYWLGIIGYSSNSPFWSAIVSPVMPASQIWLDKVAQFCIVRNLRMSIQLHKIIWNAIERGV